MSNQFEIETLVPVTMKSVNIRDEMHGSEHVSAIDIGIKWTTSNNVLSEFDGALKSMFYMKPEVPDPQGDLDGTELTDMPLLRCHAVDMPIKLNKEYAGYVFTMDRGLGGGSNVELSGCSVDNFKANCLEGGSVELQFRIQASGIDETMLGKIAAKVGQEVSVMLLAPHEVAGGVIDGSLLIGLNGGNPGPDLLGDEKEPAETPKPNRSAKDKLSATDVFIETHGTQLQ